MKDNVFNSLPIIAHAIGRRCGVRVRCGGSQAYTDGNIVQLPESSSIPRPVLLGYLVHECAHVRYTDFSIQHDNDLIRWLTNVYEDARVERKIRSAYLGASRLLMATMAFLQQEPLEPSQSTLDALLRFVALDCWCRYRAMGELLGDSLVKVEAELQPMLSMSFLDSIKAVNDRLPQAKSTADCHAMAQALYELLKGMLPSDSPTQTSKENHGTVEKAASERTPSKASGPEAEVNEVSQPSRSDGEPSDVQGCASDASSPSEPSQSTDSSKSSSTEVPSSLQSFYDITARLKAEIDQQAGLGAGTKTVLPEGPLGMKLARSQTFSDKARAMLEGGLRNSVGLRRQLQGLVQAQGRTLTRLSNRGRYLNRSKLCRLSLWNPRVFNRYQEHQTTETAVHLLVDMSGSMRGIRERIAGESALALFLALRSLPGCNPALSIFQGRGRTVGVLRHGENLTEATKPRLSVIEAGGGTPLYPALGDVLVELSMTKEKRKVIFVITDGDPDSPHETHALVKLIEKTPDTDIVGIGICSETSWLFEKSVRIDDIETLPEVLFSLAKDMALTGIR